MALKTVAARVEGDVYQGMVFWLQAAQLLRPGSKVSRVVLEHDAATGVDDVAVEYARPGIDAAGRSCVADFFQVKCHVDRSEEYAASSFCDPAFIGAKRSLLQRFHDARLRIGDSGGWHRLHLVSNWRWAQDDALGPLLRESEGGALPDRFFRDGPKSSLGRIRRVWRDHLKLTEEDFEDFARRLRLGVDFLSRRSLREWLNDRLLSCGLREIPVDRSQNPYDSLTQQFLMNGTNDFDRPTFRAMCQREGLLTEPPPRGPTVIAVRSFLRFAERLEDECSSFVCVANQFDRRHIRDSSEWQKTVLSGVRTFLNDPVFRSSEHHLLLECHSSLAFLAGYELDRKSGAQVFPIQKGVAKNLWKPSLTSAASPSANDAWRVTPEQVSPGPDVALAVSVTRDVLADVKAFLAAGGASTVGTVLDVRPELGVGTRVVADANHAVALADRFADVIRANRPRDGMSHLFIAAPNALAFFVGQHRGALGRVQLYEFDFEGERGGSYSPSIRLPD
jgi:hypothetical protein